MKRNKRLAKYLTAVYQRLLVCFGPQYWWPAQTPFEVVIGAVLTQNTAWKNVEKAIANLKRDRLLEPKRLYEAKQATIAGLIRPCGYYNLKTKRLRGFLEVLVNEFEADLSLMFALGPKRLRARLLSIKGIGPETADSIILYAADKPVFVVDAYTRRFLVRHRIISQEATYEQIQSLFEANLPRKTKLFNEYHALIVSLGKQFCRSKPLCALCPIKKVR